MCDEICYDEMDDDEFYDCLLSEYNNEITNLKNQMESLSITINNNNYNFRILDNYTMLTHDLNRAKKSHCDQRKHGTVLKLFDENEFIDQDTQYFYHLIGNLLYPSINKCNYEIEGYISALKTDNTETNVKVFMYKKLITFFDTMIQASEYKQKYIDKFPQYNTNDLINDVTMCEKHRTNVIDLLSNITFDCDVIIE